MKRKNVHLGFLGVSFASACFIAWQIWQLRLAEQINKTVEAVPELAVSGAIPERFEETDDVRIRLAWASALSTIGQDTEAERLLGILARETQANDVRVIAQYNLANHYLRQAVSGDVETNAIMPLVELSKQRYRDVLKQEPGHWHARFNLEQALRLAPEGGGLDSNEEGDPIKRVDVIVPDFERGDLP